MAFNIFTAGTKAKAAQVNANFVFIAGGRIIAIDSSTGAALEDFDIGDLTEITNGSLVNDILLREGGTIKIYNETGALQRTITLDQASTSVAGVSILPSQITISNNATDSDHDLDFGAGNFEFDDGSGQAILSAITKRFDATWVAGTGNGGKDTGALANNTRYYIYAIYNPTTGASDILATATYGSPTLPSGYTKKKYIGAFFTNGSANIRKGTYKISKNCYEFIYNDNILDVDTTNPGTSAILSTLSVPQSSKAIINAWYFDPGSDTGMRLDFPSQTDTAVSNTTVGLPNVGTNSTSDAGSATRLEIWADSSARVRYRVNGSGTTTKVRLVTVGWKEYI